MIETREELIDSLRYRQTDETYGQYIERLEEIISRWHTKHTKLLLGVRHHVKVFPEDYSSTSTIEDRAHMYSLTEDWLRDLKILVDIEQ